MDSEWRYVCWLREKIQAWIERAALISWRGAWEALQEIVLHRAQSLWEQFHCPIETALD